MPKMKFGDKSVKPEPTGFGVYDGPEPRNGVYSGVIRQMRIKKGKESGNPYFNLLVEFQDNEGEKEQYNGYPLWDMVVPGDSDVQQTRVAQLINAICGKSEASVDFNDIDAKDNPGKVTRVGGKDPVGTTVKVNVRRQPDNRNPGEYQVRIADIFPRSGGITNTPAELEVDEEVETVDAEGGTDPDGWDLDELREELEGLTLVQLKKRAKDDFEFTAADLKGKKAEEIVEAILETVSTDEEEEEDEDESLDEEQDALREELAELKLPALKKRAKEEFGLTVSDLKGLDADGIIDAILEKNAESGDDEEATHNEDGLWLYEAASDLSRDQLIAMLVEEGYDADDFDDEEEYPQESLVDTLVEEGVVAAQSGSPF